MGKTTGKTGKGRKKAPARKKKRAVRGPSRLELERRREFRRIFALGLEADAALRRNRRERAWAVLVRLSDHAVPWKEAVAAEGFRCNAEFEAVTRQPGCEDLKEALASVRQARQSGRDEDVEDHAYLRATAQRAEPVLSNKGAVLNLRTTDSGMLREMWKAKHQRELDAKGEADGQAAFQKAMQELKELGRGDEDPAAAASPTEEAP